MTLRPNVEALVGSLLDAGNEAFTVTVLPAEDHFFLRGDGLAPNEHVHGEMEVSDKALRTVGNWIDFQLDRDE